MASTVIISSTARDSGTISNGEYVMQENLLGTYELAHFQITNNLYNVVAGENDTVYLTHSVDGAQVWLFSGDAGLV